MNDRPKKLPLAAHFNDRESRNHVERPLTQVSISEFYKSPSAKQSSKKRISIEDVTNILNVSLVFKIYIVNYDCWAQVQTHGLFLPQVCGHIAGQSDYYQRDKKFDLKNNQSRENNR